MFHNHQKLSWIRHHSMLPSSYHHAPFSTDWVCPAVYLLLLFLQISFTDQSKEGEEKLHTLETPHTRHPQSCCHDVESCDRCPHRHPPLSHPGYEGSSAHCWVESANCVPDPSPPSVWAETHWTSAVVAALLHLCADCLISYWNNTLFLFYQMVRIKACGFTHSLFLQVVSHLLVFMLCQLLITILIVFGKDGLNLCICVTLSDQIKRQYTLKTGCMSVIFNKLRNTTLRDFSRIGDFPHPFRSWRSSSKFSFPPAWRKPSEMSSTAVFFSLSFIKALLQLWGKKTREIFQITFTAI